MNGPGDISLTHNNTSGSCSLIAIIPTLGMSSCRGRAEAFARRLSSKLRTLGSQADNEAVSPEDEPIINGGSANTWVTTNNDSDHTVTNLQPLRHETDSFFDFDCELESPGSPVDECEYLRLIETASNTPHNSAPESGYACTSAASSHSSTDGPYFDASNTVPSSSLLAHSLIKQPIQSSNSKETAPKNSPPADSSIQSNVSMSTSCNNCSCNGVNNLPSSKHLHDYNTLINTDESASKTTTQSLSNTNENLDNDLGAVDSAYSSEGTIYIQEKIIKELQRESQEISLADDKEHCHATEEDTEAAEATEVTENTEHIDTNKSPSQETIQSSSTDVERENEKELSKIEVCDIKDERTTEIVCNLKELSNILTAKAEDELQQSKEVHEREPTEALNLSGESKKHLPAIDTTDDEDDCRPQRVRRCSSLKTGKTPPGTPGRKKIVRFADVLGLDLADVKTFLDEIPTIPKSAFEDLEVLESEPPLQLGPKSDKLLMPLFQQPGGLPTFLDLVREKQVSLENAAVTDHINQTITGSVRVRNLDFHKSVHIRYTLDNWRSFADLQANYADKSCDGFSDKFTFTLFGNSLQIGQRLEFAVRFQCKGQQFWDNNYGTNYCFQCLPTSSPALNPIQPIVPSHHTNNNVGLLSPTAGDAWCTSFY